MSKLLFLSVLTTCFWFAPAQAQVIQTANSPALYFYPPFMKDQKISSLTLTSYKRLYKKNRIKLSHKTETAVILFDESGNALKMIRKSKGKIDSVIFGADRYRIDDVIVKRIALQNNGRTRIITRNDGEVKLELDSLERVVYSQQVTNSIEDASHVTRQNFSYDSLSRPVKYDYFYAYIGFSQKKNAYDTIPLSKTRYIFHYKANGSLGTIEEKYISIQGVLNTTYFKVSYQDHNLIVQDSEDPTSQLPEKYYGVLKKKLR